MTRQAEPRKADAKACFFFGLRPDASAADELAARARELAGRFGGRPLAACDIHLTLAFLGMRPLGDATWLAALLDGLPGCLPHDMRQSPAVAPTRDDEPIELSRLGSFGHGVVWIGPPEDPSTRPGAPAGFAHRLAERLRARLAAAQIAFDDRPLRLHVTLVRGARDFRPADVPGASTQRAVVPARWSLSLGWSDASATASRRYQWRPDAE